MVLAFITNVCAQVVQSDQATLACHDRPEHVIKKLRPWGGAALSPIKVPLFDPPVRRLFGKLSRLLPNKRNHFRPQKAIYRCGQAACYLRFLVFYHFIPEVSGVFRHFVLVAEQAFSAPFRRKSGSFTRFPSFYPSLRACSTEFSEFRGFFRNGVPQWTQPWWNRL